MKLMDFGRYIRNKDFNRKSMEKAFDFRENLIRYFSNRLSYVDQDDLEDLFTITCMYAGRYIPDVDDKFNVKLFSCAKDVLKNYYSQPNRAVCSEEDLEYLLQPKETMYYDESGINWSMVFEKIMQKLSVKERRIVKLVLDGYNLDEITQIMGYASKKSTSVIWRLILKKMRKEMERMGFLVNGKIKARLRRRDYGKQRIHRDG